MIDKAVVEKIKKLMALAANNPSEQEARSAAEKASELLIKFNLSMKDVGDLGDDDLDEKYTSYKVHRKVKDLSLAAEFVLPLITEFFFVQAVLNAGNIFDDRKTVTFYGEKTNMQIARQMYKFLCQQFNACFKRYQVETGCSLDAKESYFVGLQNGVVTQLRTKRRAVERSTELVVRKDPNLENYMHKRNPKISGTHHYSANGSGDIAAKEHGFATGQDMNLAAYAAAERQSVGHTLQLGE